MNLDIAVNWIYLSDSSIGGALQVAGLLLLIFSVSFILFIVGEIESRDQMQNVNAQPSPMTAVTTPESDEHKSKEHVKTNQDHATASPSQEALA